MPTVWSLECLGRFGWISKVFYGYTGENEDFRNTTFCIIFIKNTAMTKLLEKAIEKLKELPAKEQDHFAAMVLDDITWQETFDKSADQLDKLGEKVLKDIKAGKFKKINC